MRFLAIILTVFMLSGCETLEKITPVRTEYVVRIPPAETLTLPPEVPPLDVDKAKQSDVARWIAATETRMKTLEDKLIEVAKFLKKEQDALKK